MAEGIRIFEVGPRDGLQNEQTVLSVADRVWLIGALVDAGIGRMEAGAMVRADRVPQMAGSDEVLRQVMHQGLAGEFYALVPNRKGLERAIAAGVRHIAVFTASSDAFNQKNIGMTTAESLAEIRALVKDAQIEGITVRGYVSTVWGCPFEGRMTPDSAFRVIDALMDLSIPEVSIGDTIGVASAKGVEEVLKPLFLRVDPARIAVHFHDTRGAALANALRSYEIGVRTFDSSISGLGGCPFAPGASGNLATEDLVYYFKEMNIPTGVDYRKLCETGLRLHQKTGRKGFSSKALQAYQANCGKSAVWDS